MKDVPHRDREPAERIREVEPERLSVNWRRLAGGLSWIGFGIFLLLTTIGALSWSFWFEAATFWPVILIAVGLRMMFERSRVPWAVLISPLLLLGTMGWVAAAGRNGWHGDWRDLRAETPPGIDRWSLDGAFVFGGFDVVARDLPDDLLVEGRAATRRRAGPTVTLDEGRARVTLGPRGRDRVFMLLPQWREGWDLGVSDALPVDVDLDLAFAVGEMDLSTAPVTRMRLHGAFNDVSVRLGTPREEVDLRWEGAFNSLGLIVPDDTPVSVSKDGFVNLVDGRSRRDREGPGYRVRLEGAFNRLEVGSE